MKYYRVRGNADGVTVCKWNDKKRCLIPVRCLIKNELLTESEMRRMSSGAEFLKAGKKEILFDVCQISKNDIFWSFGVRFQCGRGVNYDG